MNARVKELFHELADLDAEARVRYFDEHDIHEETRAEVEQLLAFDAGAATILERGIGDAASRALPQLEGQGWRCGPYRLLELIGRGGMGAVHLAERVDGEVKQQVAVKLLPPGSGDLLRERFLQERQILAALVHPNIARMLDAGHADHGQPFLAMEYVEGRPIDVFTAGFSARQKITLFLKVCSAVSYLHRNLIVHRDLKPSNILVTADGEPKLLDFGIAKILDLATDATLTSMRMMTPDYASPEQVMGGRISTATDIYSLGALLYQLLTDKPAHEFTEHSAQAIAMVVTGREVTRPSKWAPDLKGDLDFILLKALRKDPQERYATVEQFAEDLHAFLESRTVRARSGNAWYRARKFVRRYWIPVSATAVVFGSLSVGLYVANRETERAIEAEAKTRVERDHATAAERTALGAEQAATTERNRAVTAGTEAIQERNRAVSEKRRADDEAATAKAVSDFLQGDLLAQASANNQARPGTKPDPDLKVRTALDRAAARIPGKFEKQPLVEAAIRQTIANTYRDLGMYPEAQPHLERAIELRAKVQGDEHPDTLSAMRDLAEIYVFQGRFAPAQILHAKVLAIRRRVLGEKHPATLDSMINLAEAYQRLRQYAEAEPIASKAVEISRRVLGEEHEATINAMTELGLIYNHEGKYAQAEALDTRLVQIEKRRLGDENPDTLTVLNNLAAVYNREGKFTQAEALRLQVLDVQRRVLGPEHNNTLISMNNLAMTYVAQGKYTQAEPIEKEALVIYRRVLGEEHPQTLTLMANLARTYVLQAKYSEAEPLYAKVLEVRRRLLGPLHPETTDLLTSFGGLLLREHRYVDAERLLREALNTLEKTHPGDWQRYNVESLLGAALSGEQRYDEAEPLLLSGYAGLSQRKETIPPIEKSPEATAGEWIVQLYRAWGREEKASEWQSKLESEKTDAIGTLRR